MPLPRRVQTDFQAAWDAAIDLLGGRFTHKRIDNGMETDIGCAAMSPTIDDQPFINEMGVEAQVLRAKANANLSKHDTLTSAASGRTYTIHALHPVNVNETQIGWRVWAA